MKMNQSNFAPKHAKVGITIPLCGIALFTPRAQAGSRLLVAIAKNSSGTIQSITAQVRPARNDPAGQCGPLRRTKLKGLTLPDPLTCPLCGGSRPAYRTTRSQRWRTQYRRCVDCGKTSKTRRWITPDDRRLTPNELATLAECLPGLRSLVADSCRFDFFIVPRPK